MRPYETMVVLSSNLGEEKGNMIDRFESIIRAEGGSIDTNHDWGIRTLAYPIHKQNQGHYYLIEYQADPQTVKELERNLRITEGVLRFLSVQQEHTGLPQARVEEAAEGHRDVPMNELRSGPHDRPAESPGEPAAPAAAEPTSEAAPAPASADATEPAPASPEAGEPVATTAEAPESPKEGETSNE